MHRTILEPKALVSSYYQALYSGELKKVQAITTQESFYMTLESFGLRVSLRDRSFKEALGRIEDDPYALVEVMHKLSKEMKSRNKRPSIQIVSVQQNGTHRQTVRFKEDGKMKMLHFSRLEGAWKVDYYAGRKVA
jgi:hypothetical protein